MTLGRYVQITFDQPQVPHIVQELEAPRNESGIVMNPGEEDDDDEEDDEMDGEVSLNISP
jgi:hypothetical protein